MKIAITANSPALEASVDPRFGRCRYFIISDTEAGSFEIADNQQNLNATQGAGIQAAENVARLGAEAVLTGHCGPKAFRTLQAAGIKVYAGVAGSVAEAIERFKAGELPAAADADVEGHWA